MANVAMTMQRLWVDRDTGRLGDVCYEAGVDLLVLHGACLRDPAQARVVDLAYSGEHPRSGERIVVLLQERFGDGVHITSLDGLDVAERREVLSGAALLVGRARGKFNDMLAERVAV